MSVVASAITPLSLPTVRAALTPSPTRPAITAESLLRDSGTLYALATDRGAGASAGLVSALIEDIAYVARVTAARSPGGRMDPPVLFLLDECANVAPIPSLPNLLADGRGQSLTIIPIFQTLAQVRSRYGDEDASTVFSATQIKLILGGSDDADDCRDISGLIGERDDWYATTSHSTHALAIDTERHHLQQPAQGPDPSPRRDPLHPLRLRRHAAVPDRPVPPAAAPLDHTAPTPSTSHAQQADIENQILRR